MNRLSTYRWLPGRAGDMSPIAITQSAYMQFRLAMVIVGLRLFFLFKSGDQSRGGARALS